MSVGASALLIYNPEEIYAYLNLSAKITQF